MPSRESPPAAAVDASGVASAVFTVLAVCAVVVVLDAGVVVLPLPVVVLFFLVVLVLVGVVVGVGLGVGFSGSFGVSVFSKIAYTSRSSLTTVSAVTVSPVPSAFV